MRYAAKSTAFNAVRTQHALGKQSTLFNNLSTFMAIKINCMVNRHCPMLCDSACAQVRSVILFIFRSSINLLQLQPRFPTLLYSSLTFDASKYSAVTVPIFKPKYACISTRDNFFRIFSQYLSCILVVTFQLLGKQSEKPKIHHRVKHFVNVSSL